MLQGRRKGHQRVVNQGNLLKHGELIKDIGKCCQFVAFKAQPLQIFKISDSIWNCCQTVTFNRDLGDMFIPDLDASAGPVSMRPFRDFKLLPNQYHQVFKSLHSERIRNEAAHVKLQRPETLPLGISTQRWGA